MALPHIPTYAEIEAFRDTLVKTRKQLSSMEFEAKKDTLVLMEYRCLRAIRALGDRPDSELMRRAQAQARLTA